MTRRRDRGAHFRGMVRIVVNHFDTLPRAQSLEATLDATERGESRCHGRHRAPEREPGAEGRHRVADVVQPRHRQVDRPEIVTVEDHVKTRPHGIEYEITSHEARLGGVGRGCGAGCRCAVGDHHVT